MEASVIVRGDVRIINLSGVLDIESAQAFQKSIQKHVQHMQGPIIFNLKQLNFVGSTGIKSFMEAISCVCEQRQAGLKMFGVKSEFQRIFSVKFKNTIEFYETENSALASFRSYTHRMNFLETDTDPNEDINYLTWLEQEHNVMNYEDMDE